MGYFWPHPPTGPIVGYVVVIILSVCHLPLDPLFLRSFSCLCVLLFKVILLSVCHCVLLFKFILLSVCHCVLLFKVILLSVCHCVLFKVILLSVCHCVFLFKVILLSVCHCVLLFKVILLSLCHSVLLFKAILLSVCTCILLFPLSAITISPAGEMQIDWGLLNCILALPVEPTIFLNLPSGVNICRLRGQVRKK